MKVKIVGNQLVFTECTLEEINSTKKWYESIMGREMKNTRFIKAKENKMIKQGTRVEVSNCGNFSKHKIKTYLADKCDIDDYMKIYGCESNRHVVLDNLGNIQVYTHVRPINSKKEQALKRIENAQAELDKAKEELKEIK